MLFKKYSLRLNTPLVLSISAIGLLMARIAVTGEYTFSFLLWNLFLARIPLFIMEILYHKSFKSKATQYFLIFLWTIFLPNSPYMVTDLIHLKISSPPIIWLDILMFFLFSLAGLMFGFKSLHIAEKSLKSSLGQFYSGRIFILIIISCGFGIYLGRIERMNSWDLMIHPVKSLLEIKEIYLGPDSTLFPWYFSLMTGIILLILYEHFYLRSIYENESKSL